MARNAFRFPHYDHAHHQGTGELNAQIFRVAPARILAGLPYELARVPLGDLSVHPRVQRAFRPKWAPESLAKHFDESAFDTIWGTCTGGQDAPHLRRPAPESGCRKALSKGTGWEVVEVPCRIYDNLDTATLATLTGGKNNSLNWTAIAEFRRAVLANDPVAVAIEKMLKGLGLKVREDGKRPDTVRAVKALRDVYGWAPDGPALLAMTVAFLHEAWPEDKDALHQCMIKGSPRSFQKTRQQHRPPGLLHRLRAYDNATVILGKGRNYAESTGVTVPQAILATLQRTYNTKRRSGKVAA